jgi:putative RNA 2'-phosphotransferase
MGQGRSILGDSFMAKHNLEKRRDSLDKFLLYVLGVAPDEFGLLPDREGFVSIKELLGAIRGEEGFRGVTEGSVNEILNFPGGQGALEREGNRVRVKPDRASFEFEKPKSRPKLLYFGLKPTAWPSVSAHGLRPKPDEEFIKLFPTKEAALKVHSRFCPNSLIITVNVSKAESGQSIIEAVSENLYKTKELKAEALSGPPLPQRSEADDSKGAQKTDLPGQSLYGAVEPVAHHGKKKGKFQDTPDWKIRTRIDRRKGQA